MSSLAMYAHQSGGGSEDRHLFLEDRPHTEISADERIRRHITEGKLRPTHSRNFQSLASTKYTNTSQVDKVDAVVCLIFVVWLVSISDT
jgi:hypothetical protein